MENEWIHPLEKKLRSRLSQDSTLRHMLNYLEGLSKPYIEKYSEEEVITDLIAIEKITESVPIRLSLYEAYSSTTKHLRIKIYQLNQPIPLSDALPLLENMGLRTISEELYEIKRTTGPSIWISDYTVTTKQNFQLTIDSIKNTFQDMFIQVYLGYCENDGFNTLCLAAGLTWREICIIRVYVKYLAQTGFRFSQHYIEKTLAMHPSITNALISLFILKHNPHHQQLKLNELEQLQEKIKNLLETVSSLDEDRILRRFFILINATLRTNFFQTELQGQYKNYITIKIDSRQVPELPPPHPLYDTFVYSTRFEGIHLRGEKIARGGIRWSDRPEDFRTEILGLMKAQKVKNAIIVPSGAKGGFVLKKIPAHASREAIQQEAIACYKLFISGLLDITDNIKNNRIERPKNVICYDDEDTYLVVAADKGTASFSDIANKISADYGFWLGDAFASGGSAGYDHKKMGITAKGAWESIKRHFRELDINATQEAISMVGIGDMSGDVFGNGAIYSKNIRLVAAFDHRHIFIDPYPNTEAAYNERLRLFNLPQSSWEDFNPAIISRGGGVYKRNVKNITLSAEAKKVLGIIEDELSPNELIRAILKAPVDLLFNGGIGTYVKSSQENHDAVGDKTNEFCRVNGCELRCKVVGEGGNLGFTQLGRIEFALQGGLINTDFIDNSAGVDCSDHEVNIKILLHKSLANNELTLEERNLLLSSMTADITNLVLQDNYHQALTMSFSSFHAVAYVDLYHQHIQKLENFAGLSRSVEYLPDDKQLLERKTRGQGLTRPELAVLLAYTKIHVKNEILKSASFDDIYLNCMLSSAFPKIITKQFFSHVEQHYLKKHIIATQVSNLMINKMGVTFPYRLQSETGSSIENVAHAFLIAYNIYHASHLQEQLEIIENKLPIKFTYQVLHIERQLLNMATRWFLRQNRLRGPISQIISHYENKIALLEEYIPQLIVGETKTDQQYLIEQCMQAGLSQKIAQRIAISRVMYTALNIIEIATLHHFDLLKTAEVYFATGGKFNLVWFRDKLAKDSREGLRNNLARLTLRDDLDTLQRQLTIAILQTKVKEKNTDRLLKHWINTHHVIFNRWQDVITSTQENTEDDYTMYFITLRELTNLINFSGEINYKPLSRSINITTEKEVL